MRKIEFVFICFFVGILLFTGCGRNGDQNEITEEYKGFRKLAFSIEPADLGVENSQDGSDPVLGMLMETGYTDAVVTLLLLRDGTISLYYSSGGGSLGIGQYDGARKTADEMLQMAHNYLGIMEKTDTYPLPQKNSTRFYLLTVDGVVTIEESGAALGGKDHALYPLFVKGQQLIKLIQLLDEKMESQ